MSERWSCKSGTRQWSVRLIGFERCCTIVMSTTQVKSGTIFDNVLITDSEEYAEEFGSETWGETKGPEKKMKEEV